MTGLLADANIGRVMDFLRLSLRSQDLESILDFEGILFRTFGDLGLDRHIDDRSLWNFCQSEGWVLFTDDRNDDGPDSLQATMNDSWKPGLLPVVTPSRKQRLEQDRDYCDLVACHVAQQLIDIASGEGPDQPRIFVPLNV